MNEQVVIIDYGSGNLRSAVKAFERAAAEAELDCTIELTGDTERVLLADRIVLPGVGAFADCKRGLSAVPGMIDALNEKVRKQGVPFLGICVGMQLMCERGLEKAVTPGLGWIAGEVVRIEPEDPTIKIPQIGWNTLDIHKEHPLLQGIDLGPDGYHAYFVHSYQMKLTSRNDLIASTNYGGEIAAMVGRDNMVGTQFHPEKSQALGLALIANFLRWTP